MYSFIMASAVQSVLFFRRLQARQEVLLRLLGPQQPVQPGACPEPGPPVLMKQVPEWQQAVQHLQDLPL
jgi:hypothetical protein